jgi:hypothetical protein
VARCTDADFEEHRPQRAWTRWKYEMHETGCKLPTQMSELRSRCFCRAGIDSGTMNVHVAGFTWLKRQMSEPDGSDFKPKRRVLVFLGVVLLLLLAMQLFNAIR